MKKELKDYLHLYLGCDCIVTVEDVPPYTAKVTGLQRFNNTPHVEGINNGGYGLYSFDEVKIILRSLSDLTEEEVKYFGKSPLSLEELKQHFNDSPFFTPNEYIYLLKNGFDLFGLIECGLAIDKTTLTNTNS